MGNLQSWLAGLGGLRTASETAGYCGAGLIAFAYLLNQRGVLPSNNWRFPASNLVGSLLIMVSLAFHPNAPSVVIEVFWSAISLYGVYRNVRAARQARAP